MFSYKETAANLLRKINMIENNRRDGNASGHGLEFRTQLGGRIRRIWEASGMTQAAFSHSLDITSVTLLHYMKGRRMPDALFICLLGEKHSVCFDWLFTGRGAMRAGEAASSPPSQRGASCPSCLEGTLRHERDSEVKTLHKRLIDVQDKLIKLQDKYAKAREEMLRLYGAGEPPRRKELFVPVASMPAPSAP